MHMRLEKPIDILLVDDREDGLIALEALLSEDTNYNLVMAQSGYEAIELMPQYDFAMILLDVQMPGIDGFETAEMIRRQPRYKSIPIVFVTAINKDERYVYRGYETGAVDYIFKPFDPLILRSKVAVFADLYSKTRQLKEQALKISQQEALEHQAYVQSVELQNLRRYRNLADSIPHMVWRAAPDGTLEYYNNLWCSYTGLPLDESLGIGWQQAFNKLDLRNLLRVWMKAMQTGESFEVECRIRRADGTYRWHWVRAVAEFDVEAKVIAWLGTCTDIEERKQDEEKVLQAQKTAEMANQAKTQFLANMSHEIRTPLNAIIGFTELMLDPHLSVAEKMSNISIVRRNGQQLIKIIDEILDISKVEAGGLEVELIETDLLSMISGIRSLLNVVASKKRIKLEFAVDGTIPDRIVTDGTRLRQILINIVGNALKFTERGHVRLTAKFLSDEEPPHLQFLVEDTGVGLEPGALEKIFTPFSQADCSTTRVFGGTGLGLALSRKLAQALGGDVTLEKSAPGFGSTFRIQVEGKPLPHAVWISKFSDLDDSDTHAVPSYKNQELLGKRILLVEDAEDNQVLISRFLQKTGAEIDIASNGKEGVEKALAKDYSVVLMDIQMPLLDGYEATSRLRQVGYQKPIIALTAHALIEEREKCLRTGCNGHLTKPINRQLLIESLLKYSNEIQ